MLKRAFALSDQGAKDLAKGIIATACANLIQIIPASLLLMVVMMLLEKAAGTRVNVGRNIPFFVGITLVLFGMIAIAQLVQYNLTYTAAYKESANRRIVLAEKLRKLPLSFFEKKNLADLTTTIMGDCTALERTFSNAIPQLLGTILMFVIMSVGLAVLDWRMALCIIVPVPVASIVVVLARKAQSKAELENLEAKRCAYDAVQEYIDTIKELKAYSKTDVYLDELDKKLENVIRCSFRNELAPGASTTAAQFILRFGLVAVLLIGGNLVIEGMLSIPMLILFLLFAGRIYDPFTNCFMLLQQSCGNKTPNNLGRNPALFQVGVHSAGIGVPGRQCKRFRRFRRLLSLPAPLRGGVPGAAVECQQILHRLRETSAAKML